MILFNVCAYDGEEDLSLFVTAHSREEAVTIWQKWAADAMGVGVDADAQPKWVFLVPKIGDTPGYHAWHADPKMTSPSKRGTVLVPPEWSPLETIAHAINHGITSYSQSNTKVNVD